MSKVSAADNHTTTTVVDLAKPMAQRTPNELVKTARNLYNAGQTRRISFRREQLKKLLKFLEENEGAICEALERDLRKPKFEARMLELDLMKNEIIYTLENLGRWCERQVRDKSLAHFFDQLYVYPEPYGVVLVMGAWNYPLQLTLMPVIGAIAAGNCVIIKPSDISVHTSQLLANLLPLYIDKDCYPVFLGGIPETTDLLKEHFDYIFFTGAPSIGKIVHKAAAEHLTPTTLELGGKSPVYIDESANMRKAVKRILWGKCVNAGQTCIAPDYVLCTKSVQEEFVRHATDILKQFYKGDIKNSRDYCRIVSSRHFHRLVGLLPGLKVAIGGGYDPKDLFMEPTIAVDVSPNDVIMQEEIFGPILPIMPISNVDEAIDFINRNEKPLAMYIFSAKSTVRELFLAKTSSGGVCVNDTMMHVAPQTLPFGGVGHSGMGAYHGKSTFDVFTHFRSVLIKNFAEVPDRAIAARYPPYTSTNLKMITMAMKKRRGLGISLKYLPHLLMFVLGVVATFLFMEYLM